MDSSKGLAAAGLQLFYQALRSSAMPHYSRYHDVIIRRPDHRNVRSPGVNCRRGCLSRDFESEGVRAVG